MSATLLDSLREKQAKGVKQIRVTTVISALEAEQVIKPARKNGKVQKLDLVGTAEAAKMLGVERPRIGRWRKAGIMPEPVGEIAAGPVWLRSQIEGMQGEREKRRRVHAPES